MTEFHCNCGATITGTKRDVATHLAECATTTAPRPPAPPAMRADSDIVDPETGEVIAGAGDALTDEVLYRLECIGWYMNRCEHYGDFVPPEFNGCGECLLADACYSAWEASLERAREAA